MDPVARSPSDFVSIALQVRVCDGLEYGWVSDYRQPSDKRSRARFQKSAGRLHLTSHLPFIEQALRDARHTVFETPIYLCISSTGPALSPYILRTLPPAELCTPPPYTQLAHSIDVRSSLSSRILALNYRLFHDTQAVSEWDKFLAQVVEKARRLDVDDS